MMEFLDYVKAEQILKQQEVKEAIALIPKILSICIKKELDFSLCESAKVIDIRNLSTGYCLVGYYSETLVNYESEKTNNFKIKTIYQKVKAYKP